MSVSISPGTTWEQVTRDPENWVLRANRNGRVLAAINFSTWAWTWRMHGPTPSTGRSGAFVGSRLPAMLDCEKALVRVGCVLEQPIARPRT